MRVTHSSFLVLDEVHDVSWVVTFDFEKAEVEADPCEGPGADNPGDSIGDPAVLPWDSDVEETDFGAAINVVEQIMDFLTPQ